MKLQDIPSRKGRGMPIFAIALVPEGNIIRIVRATTSLSLKRKDSPNLSALPEGVYLGFFSPGKKDRQDRFIKEFRKSAGSLFASLPPQLRFSSCEFVGDHWYIVPDAPLSTELAMTALAIAAEAGFTPLDKAPLLPGQGFFAGNDVTPPPFEAFSFRHLDALLYRIESADDRFDKAWWTVLARVPRRTGPRSSSPRCPSML
ncbi:MAG: hypothetical protein WBH66_02065 [Rectinemataceae bacterium]